MCGAWGAVGGAWATGAAGRDWGASSCGALIQLGVAVASEWGAPAASGAAVKVHTVLQGTPGQGQRQRMWAAHITKNSASNQKEALFKRTNTLHRASERCKGARRISCCGDITFQPNSTREYKKEWQVPSTIRL